MLLRLGASADEIGLPDVAARRDHPQRARVILDIKPVADVCASP